MKVHFVTHYISLSEEEIQEIKKRTATFTEYPPQELMEIMFNSVRRLYPDAKCTILSDMDSLIPPFFGVSIKRYPRGKGVISSQIRAYLGFLEVWNGSDPVVFLDWDMILQKEITALFDRDCDLLLTFRNHPQAPINTGLMILPKNASRQVAQFFQTILYELEGNPEYQHSEWIGDQIIASELLKNPVALSGLKIQLLKCETFNFTPSLNDPSLFYPTKVIIHFKGKRKSLMIRYWRQHFTNS